jgi:hypothetical protein
MSKKLNISFEGKEISIENGNVTVIDDRSWIKESVYGIESLLIDPKTMDCDAHYSIEKFLGEKKDDNAPAAGKMRITWLGLGSNVEFTDGSKVKNDMNSVFTSPYVKEKIKEFNNYYINEKGYRPFTSEDQKSFKIDLSQFLRKIYSISLMQKLQIKWFDETAIYGLFSHLLGKALDNLLKKESEGGLGRVAANVAGLAAASGIGKVVGGAAAPLSQLFKVNLNSGIDQAPFCIVYVKENQDGTKRVFIRRFLVVGIWSSKLLEGHSKWRSGGKEIGTVK